jgi:hypothetical protein
MEVPFARYCANDGGPFRQVLRWGAIVAVPVNLVQRGRMLLVPRLEDFRTSTIGWGSRAVLILIYDLAAAAIKYPNFYGTVRLVV